MTLFRTWLVLALAGAILPYVIFIPWLTAHGLNAGLFFDELYATAPATIFALDVLFAAMVFVIFVFAEGRRLGMGRLWVYPVVTFAIGLCCALPLFLAFRERRLAA